MTNKDFYQKLEQMLEDRTLIYACGNLPDMYVRIKVGGHFIATSVENADFLHEIRQKEMDNQFFTESQLGRYLGKSSTFVDYEVTRGKYARIKTGKFKLYIIKNW